MLQELQWRVCAVGVLPSRAMSPAVPWSRTLAAWNLRRRRERGTTHRSDELLWVEGKPCGQRILSFTGKKPAQFCFLKKRLLAASQLTAGLKSLPGERGRWGGLRLKKSPPPPLPPNTTATPMPLYPAPAVLEFEAPRLHTPLPARLLLNSSHFENKTKIQPLSGSAHPPTHPPWGGGLSTLRRSLLPAPGHRRQVRREPHPHRRPQGSQPSPHGACHLPSQKHKKAFA